MMQSTVREDIAVSVPRMTGARVFVTTVFILLGATFIASTALLVHEFNDRSLPALVMMHSHLFVFFPILGILALAAFRLPAIVFTHLYWTRIRFGKLRFLIGTALVLAATMYTSWGLTNAAQHSIWELSPAVLASDRATPPTCDRTNGPCTRARISETLTELRAADLRFTPDEAAAFLTQVMGLTLNAADISTLEARTEGWIAGLQLAALSLQGREDISGFLKAFTGDH
ncbi:MAG TPA: hypothetical protein PK970_08415, partial [Hyphomicrobiaceae bacterium]|nr:hypothetical protein [Hyphomicrobiaceae bacterium]